VLPYPGEASKQLFLFVLFLTLSSWVLAQAPGYKLWMDYAPATNEQRVESYRKVTAIGGKGG